jgi:hypothetical protein
MKWLEERGLTLAGELAEDRQGGPSVNVIGSYKDETHVSLEEFYSLPNVILETKALSNAEYTLARITESNGVRCVHTLHCSCRHRPVFNYLEIRELQG